MLPHAQRINQADIIYKENDDFIKNVKRSMSFDTIKDLKQKNQNN